VIETDEGFQQGAVFVPKPCELRCIVDRLERELFRLRLAITPAALRTASKMLTPFPRLMTNDDLSVVGARYL